MVCLASLVLIGLAPEAANSSLEGILADNAKLIIKSLHAMCVLSSWEKTKFVPKNGKSGQTEREAGQQKMMKYLVS